MRAGRNFLQRAVMLNTMKSASKHNTARRVSGFTLIELMVALVIGSIVIGAVMALVLSMMRANRDTIAATKLTQELRSIAQVVSSDLRRAGAAEDPFLLSGTGSVADFSMTTPAVGATTTTAVYRYAGLGAARTVALSNGQVTINGAAITSDVVRVTALSFERGPDPRTLRLTLTGELRRDAPGSDVNDITRSYVQTMFAPGLTTP